MTGKISMFGTLAQRGVAGDNETQPGRQQGRTRLLLVAVRVDNQILERPGVLLEWVQKPLGWTARVAYVADEEGTLIVAWLPADQLTPCLRSELTAARKRVV